MINFAVFALYLCFSAMALIVAPVMMVPGMPMKRKLLISGFAFFVLVPLGLVLYAWLGVPKMAVIG